MREHGTASLTALQKSLKLPCPVGNAIFQQLGQQMLIEVKGTAGSDYIFVLTSAARELAAERSEMCRYAGPAPVTLDQYAAVVRSQRPTVQPTGDLLCEAFADLVVTDGLLDRLAPALTSREPVFVYGPSGNGKTSIIERLPRIYGDTILVPMRWKWPGRSSSF